MYTTFCFSAFPLLNVWVVSAFWLLWIMLQWTLTYEVCFESLFSVLLVTYTGVGLLDHIVMLYLAFWGTTKLFSILAALFYIPASSVQESQDFPACSLTPPYVSIIIINHHLITIIIAILLSVKWYLLVLICISLMTSNDEQPISCVYWPFVYLLWRNVYLVFFVHLKVELFVFLLLF